MDEYSSQKAYLQVIRINDDAFPIFQCDLQVLLLVIIEID
jgi:hypothetical protein